MQAVIKITPLIPDTFRPIDQFLEGKGGGGRGTPVLTDFKIISFVFSIFWLFFIFIFDLNLTAEVNHPPPKYLCGDFICE